MVTSPTLHFIVPVRHQQSVRDWDVVQQNLKETLASIVAQTAPNWRAVVVTNRGAEVPPMPEGVQRIEVDLTLPTMPDRKTDRDAYFDVIRDDKGKRVLAGLGGVAPTDYVMVVDYDDWVSNQLAGFVAEHAGAPGWYLRDGYVSDGRPLIYLHREFHEKCGTSHIVRFDLLGLSTPIEESSGTAVKKYLGSHKFVRSDLAARGEPLAPLPFPGAVYRIGGPTSSLGTAGVIREMLPFRKITQPWLFAKRLVNFRLMDNRIASEFTISRNSEGASSAH